MAIPRKSNGVPGNRFTAYGFTFQLDAPPPPSAQVALGFDADTIQLEIGAVPAALRAVAAEDEFVQVSSSEFLFACEYQPRVLISEGSVVRAEARLCGTCERRYWDCVLGVGASFIGVQRGYYPLHAATIVSNGACVSLAGRSGAGKSTLAAGLCRDGAALVSDDLTLIRGDGTNWYVSAGPSQVRLLPDALARLGICSDKSGEEAGKEYVQLAQTAAARPPLTRVYFLTVGDDFIHQRIQPMSSIRAMQHLIENNRLFMRLSALPRSMSVSTFRLLAEMSNQLEFYEVLRSNRLRCFANEIQELKEHMKMKA